MGYIAVEHLKWGDGWISPGEAVPDDDASRDYAGLLRTGQIRETAGDSSGDAAADASGLLKALPDEVFAEVVREGDAADLLAAVGSDEELRERLVETEKAEAGDDAREVILALDPPPAVEELSIDELTELSDDDFAEIVRASEPEALITAVDGDEYLTDRLIAAEREVNGDEAREEILALNVPELEDLTHEQLRELTDEVFAKVVADNGIDDLKKAVEGDDELTARLVTAEQQVDKPRKGIVDLAPQA